MNLRAYSKALILSGVLLCAAQLSAAQAGGAAADSAPQRAAVTRTAPASSEEGSPSAAVRSKETKSSLAANVRGVNLSDAELETHEMLPANVVGAQSDEGLDENEQEAPVRALISRSRTLLEGAGAAAIASEIEAMPMDKPSPDVTLKRGVLSGAARVKPGLAPEVGKLAAPPKPHLDVSAFGQAFHAAIKDNVAGYALRIAKNGQTIYTLQWNWAQTPSDASLGWNTNRRMHIASVSKLMTGIAMTRLLQEKNISPDAKIINYLPSYWQKGPNINNITFRHLMNHRSGFSTGGSSSDYQFMKTRVAMGVPSVGGYDYENMNFGLCRILIAIINGNISKNTLFPAMVNDQLWDAITISAYENYVNQKVFAPAGVSGPTLEKPASPARAYAFPVAGGGWNSGDLNSMAGGAAWHMSINEILAVMHALRHSGQIMAPSKAQDMLDNGFGIDRIIDTSAGKLYEKNGLWRDGNQRTEQSVAVFWPDGLDIVVFTNSPIGAGGASLRNLVRDLYIANIVEP